uniref:Candidate secreted effector n=1 Tax=Meloidogyne incognita TaxID=6306 RepID=A0A914L133_MELIC
MCNKTTIFFIFAICLLINQIVSEKMPSLAECCKGCTKKNDKNCKYEKACECVSANYDPATSIQCKKDDKKTEKYVKKNCK